jgi:hypothetical protein
MARKNSDDRNLKLAVKEAVAEALNDHRELLHEIFAEVLEDFALAEAIREGQQTPQASRAEVFRILSKNA